MNTSLCSISAHAGLCQETAREHIVRFDLDCFTLIYFRSTQRAVTMYSSRKPEGIKAINVENVSVMPTKSSWRFDISVDLRICGEDDWVQVRTFEYTNVVASTFRLVDD